MKVRVNSLLEYFDDKTNEAELIKIGTEFKLADIGTKEMTGIIFYDAEESLSGNYTNQIL